MKGYVVAAACVFSLVGLQDALGQSTFDRVMHASYCLGAIQRTSELNESGAFSAQDLQTCAQGWDVVGARTEAECPAFLMQQRRQTYASRLNRFQRYAVPSALQSLFNYNDTQLRNTLSLLLTVKRRGYNEATAYSGYHSPVLEGCVKDCISRDPANVEECYLQCLDTQDPSYATYMRCVSGKTEMPW